MIAAAATALGAVAGIGDVAGAQANLGRSGQRTQATRAELEAAATAAERLARASGDSKIRERKAEEATSIRERLREGDFQPGHRIYLQVSSDSALSDTFTVRSDRKLLLPNLPEISLDGVLDSELQSFMTEQVSKYVRNPTVRATALLRIAVMGAVKQPGYYSMPTDMGMSDVVMMAGGPSPTAQLPSSVVRRGSKTVLGKDAVSEALRRDLTLSDLGVRPGDELFIPDKTQTGWGKILGSAGAISGALISVIWLARRIN
jgi:hypothetical protein